MLKAIMFKFNVQIKIANKKTILLKDFIHTTTPDVSAGGGGRGYLRNFWVWDVPLGPWNLSL